MEEHPNVLPEVARMPKSKATPQPSQPNATRKRTELTNGSPSLPGPGPSTHDPRSHRPRPSHDLVSSSLGSGSDLLILQQSIERITRVHDEQQRLAKALDEERATNERLRGELKSAKEEYEGQRYQDWEKYTAATEELERLYREDHAACVRHYKHQLSKKQSKSAAQKLQLDAELSWQNLPRLLTTSKLHSERSMSS